MLAGGDLLCVQGRSPFAICHPVIHLTFCPVGDKLDFCNYKKYRKLLHSQIWAPDRYCQNNSAIKEELSCNPSCLCLVPVNKMWAS